jgi:hypothetical protein
MNKPTHRFVKEVGGDGELTVNVRSLLIGTLGTTVATAFVLTSTPALAKKPTKPYFVDAETCIAYMSTAMPDAVEAALARVGSCLAGLNASMASAIKKFMKSGKVTFSCSNKNVKGHGRTIFFKNGAILIEIDSPNFSGDAYEPASGDSAAQKSDKAKRLRDDLSATLFHEIIHASDKSHKLINSAEIHNSSAGVPDPVYGCSYACFPGTAQRVRDAMLNAGQKLVIPKLAEKKGFACPFEIAGPCSALRKYANLCHTGKTVKLQVR